MQAGFRVVVLALEADRVVDFVDQGADDVAVGAATGLRTSTLIPIRFSIASTNLWPPIKNLNLSTFPHFIYDKLELFQNTR